MVARKRRDDDYEDQASYPDPFQKRDDGFFSPKLNEPHLHQDHNPPAAPPADVHEHLPIDYPAGDTNIEPSEVYDEGPANATDAEAQDETRPTGTVRPLDLEHEDEDEE